jgi:transposase
LKLERSEEAITRALDLAGCYVVTTDVARADLSAQQVHDSYVSLARVERDFRTLKRGLLEVRPVWVRKEGRTRGHVFCGMLALKVSREMERRLRVAFGTTEIQADAITLPHALLALTRLCLLHYPVDEKTTVTRLPQPDARQREILQALGATLPAM